MNTLNLPKEGVFKNRGGVENRPYQLDCLIAHDLEKASEEVVGMGFIGVIGEVLQ